MRPPVPFIGEKLILRDDENQGDSKRHGQIIDEVLSTAADTSSWEDNVPASSRIPSPTSSLVVPPASSKQRPAAIATIPADTRSTSKPSATSDSGPRMEWIPINNGQGLRINISGTIDQALRREWLLLLSETASKEIDQFEFNLTRTPELGLTGLSMLLLFREQKHSQRQNITLCHCNRQVWELLQWTGMDRYFVIQGATLEEKVKA